MSKVPNLWFERPFDSSFLPDDHADVLLERLVDVTDRCARRVAGLDERALTERAADKAWSIQEHVGHLVDLEALWLGRIGDLERGLPRLRPADLANAATYAADHNVRPIGEVLTRLATARSRLVDAVRRLPAESARWTAQHPRLDQPMRVVDLLFFVAEHDDHHLATISRLRAEPA